MEVCGVIYCITCLINGKKYVGQTKRPLKVRFREHTSKNFLIGKVIRKYGTENFTIEEIEKCMNQEQLNEREMFWIAHFNCMIPNGYNCTSGGEGKIITPKMSVQRSVAATRFWASKSKDERSLMAKEREARKSPESRSKSARKAAATRNLNVETHAKMSKAQRYESPYKNLLSEMDKHNLSYCALTNLFGVAKVSEKIRDKRHFTAKDVVKLVELFDKPAEYLMARDY